MPEASSGGECTTCRGSGRVLLLTTSQPCDACGGTGRAGAPAAAAGAPDYFSVAASAALRAAAEEAEAGTLVTYRRYDAAGRLLGVAEERAGSAPAIYTYDGGGDGGGAAPAGPAGAG